VSNATFSNISVIAWRPVLVVEEAGVPRENHQPYEQATGKVALDTINQIKSPIKLSL
jgi:hypothetical protein